MNIRDIESRSGAKSRASDAIKVLTANLAKAMSLNRSLNNVVSYLLSKRNFY